MALGVGSAWAAPPAPTTLPVPCAPGACGNAGPGAWISAGKATAIATQNSLTVNQSSNSAILNWSSFDIGKDASVTFKQPSASAVALNKIFQGNPSQIFGKLDANGQVYLINLNGFIFGPTARVNTGSLIASSLPLTLTDATFSDGILSPLQNNLPTFDATKDPLVPGVGRIQVLDVNGNPVVDSAGKPIPVSVAVQEGAQISAASQGRVLVTGQSVTNAGTITAPNGQVVLAAGTQVYLQADTDPSLRGLVVEVNASPDNKAWNQLTGLLSAPGGNVTMVGLAVNQDGRISATTSVSANGSVRLEAAQGAQFGGGTGSLTVSSSQGGKLTLGATSDIEVLPELDSKATAVADQQQYPSSVTLLGEQVVLQGGTIKAPGGTLTVIAAANPAQTAVDPTQGVAGGDANARLHIDAGVSIDLSGSTTTLPVTANLVSAQLRSGELADDPTQRDGALHGQTVYVDARQGNPLIANVSGEIAGIPQTIAQRTEQGGTAIFQSEGDLVYARGAALNVSGGWTNYTGGVMQTSYLVGADGHLYPIATADPLLTYVGVVNPTVTENFNSWGVQAITPSPGLSHYEPGYVQGASAGSVQFAAPNMVLQGALSGSAVNGVYQRTPASAVAGGQLLIGVPTGINGSGSNPPIDYLAPGVRITPTPTPVAVSDDTTLTGSATVDLPVNYLTSSGFTSTRINSNYEVTLPANTALHLPDGGALAVNAARIDILSDITAPGGALSFQNQNTLGSATGAGGPRPGVYVGDDTVFDVRGEWTNDSTFLTAPNLAQTWQNGGSVSLGTVSPGAMLSIGDNVAIHASGGAWVDSTGKLTPGLGGSIALNEVSIAGGLSIGSGLSLDAFGVNGAAGGSLSLAGPRLEIGGGTSFTQPQLVDDTIPASTPQQSDPAVAPGGVLHLGADLFASDGFGSVSLRAAAPLTPNVTDTLLVDPGTVINATVSSLALQPGYLSRPSAETLDTIAAPGLLPAYLRPSESITLTAQPPGGTGTPQGVAVSGQVHVGSGALIATDALGKITLNSLGSILVEGTLRAPAGSVALHITPPDSSSADPGFLADQRIDLAAGGMLDVSGTFVPRPSSTGLLLGTAYGAGSISLFADRGAVLTEAGSYLSASGISAALDSLQQSGLYAHSVMNTAGGSIGVRSGESIALLGAINAGAGSGGNSGAAIGGSLEVDLTRSQSWWSSGLYPDSFNHGPLTVDLSATAPSTSPAPPAGSNLALLGAQQMMQSGIDTLHIVAGDTIRVSGPLNLDLARSLILDAPSFAAAGSARAILSAPYVEVGNEALTGGGTPVTSAGSGALTFKGAEIDLVGALTFQNISNLTFVSTGDLLLRGTVLGSAAGTYQGGVNVMGGVMLDAARIYPTTATNYLINATEDPASGAPGTVSIGQTGANPGTPLSAGSALTINANVINSQGTLYAPFGSITLNALNSLALSDGSLTSVSGAGLTIPYGQTQFGGEQWIYPGFIGNQLVAGVPARPLTMSAPSVTISPRATIDLSGGGDLLANEWVPGSGGTKDVLANGAAMGLYAIVPSTLGQSSPHDSYLASQTAIAGGQTVYLSGGNGLAAGFYPLLPAQYALLPGAYLVRVEPQIQSNTAGALGSLTDGTPVIAGYLSYGNTGLHQTPGYTGFAVYPGTYGNQLAEYDPHLASSFFASAAASTGGARPVLPVDAGSLTIAVTTALDAQGVVRSGAASGGIAASIAITANDLIVGDAQGALPADAIHLSTSVLSSWAPGTLLLGGTLTPPSDSADATPALGVDVRANTVIVGAGTLTAGQIVLVANQSIELQSGAQVQSTSVTGGTAPAVPSVETVELSGSGASGAAFLAVSDTHWLQPLRAAGATGGASLAIDSGATLASRGALTIDTAGLTQLHGTLDGAGAEWSLGSSSIAFVPDGVQADALDISPTLAAQLGTAGALRLASTGAIDLLTAVDLGGASHFSSLTLSAASLGNGASNPQASSFTADRIVLGGRADGTPVVFPQAGPAGAALTLSAGEIDVAAGTLAVTGFATTQLSAAALRGVANGTVSVGGDLGVNTAALTAGSGVDTVLAATGNLNLQAGSATATPVQTLGGSLALSGDNVTVATALNAASGLVSLSALHDLTLGAGAAINTAGRAVGVGNQLVNTPGGAVSLAAGGNLSLASGSSVDVSGATGAAAGSVALASGGAASVGGVLQGSATGGANGGSFALLAGNLAEGGTSGGSALSALVTTLTTGGFTQAANVRVHTGDLSLDAGSAITANSVWLATDTGRMSIAGTVTAPSGAQRGSIAIFGGDGVELQSTAALHADSASAEGRGGTIEIGAGALVADGAGVLSSYSNAAITLDAGAKVSASGSGAMGSLWLRAPALTASNDVAIQLASGATLADVVSGAQGVAVGQVIVEPVMVFNTATAPFSSATAPSSADFQAIGQNAANYMAAAAPGIQARLSGGAMLPLAVQAGIEVVAPGDLTLPALDLAPTAGGLNWRFGGQPVDLTLRAAGNVELTGNLSDGFDSQLVGSTQQPTLLNGSSASLGLVAGADLSSANPYANSATLANLTFDAGAYARTGTGNIHLAASGNIVLAGAGSGAFTAGVPAVAAGATVGNPYPGLPAALGSAQLDAGSTYGTGVLIPRSDLVMSLPTAGGSLSVQAGKDIINASATAAGAPTTWQLREGGGAYAGDNGAATAPATWGVNLAAFNYNFATLGGGDLSISAGRDVTNLSAAAAGSLLPHADGGALEALASGALTISAGRNIGSAQLFLADGRGTVTAGGALSAVLPSVQDPTQFVGSAFFLQSSQFDVASRLGMQVDAIYNPTALAQVDPTGGLLARALTGSFFSYSRDSALNLQTMSGDVVLGQPVAVNETLLGQRQTEASGVGVDVLPASLTVASLQGNIETGSFVNGSALLTLYPSNTGQLSLLAGQDISGGSYAMSDARGGSYPTLISPLLAQPLDSRGNAFQGNLHSDDTRPALVSAGGNISTLSLSVPKPTAIYAGNDVTDLTFLGENLGSSDLTLISAGRDITYSNSYSGLGMSVGGPGNFDLLAGRNIALGFSSGVVTSGNLLNANLPTAQGANLTLATGLGTAPDFAGFFSKLVTLDSSYAKTLINYVQGLQGGSDLSFTQAQAAFMALNSDQQRPFIDGVFFNELLLSGRAANASVNPAKGFAQGYAAIDALYPGSRDDGNTQYAGDLTLSFSRIYTLSGGNINLLVPGGMINVGLANPPATLLRRPPSTLGIVAQGTGDVDIYTKGDVDVNSSRIFTLGGGNILIWSTTGSIDAGKGAKTALSAPPPSVLINADGTVSLNFQGAATGSGIRTIQTDPASPLGSVDLDAPVGTVDAGDAGIGAAGNINIAAQSVIGLSNINFGGTATGVPAQVSGLSASLSGASSAASSTTNAATSGVQNAAADKDAAAPLAQTALSWLDVFVTGLGEENCKPDDVDCLKRQKTTH